MAEVSHDVLKYKESNSIEMKLSDATQLTLTDKAYDAVIHFEKIN